MANNQIVISRIQHRRGRRENLPQPLNSGEVALTADTNQAWIGNDPDISVPAIRVYKDKNISLAQGILDTNIVEAKFDGTFTSANFTTLVAELLADATITLTSNDILYDDTYRGEILDFTITTPGTNYTDGSVITVVSSTGSGFVGTVTCAVSPGPITGVTVTDAGQNYSAGDSVTVAGGDSNAVLTLADGDVHGTTVLIAVRSTVTSNTVAKINTALNNSSLSSQLISSGAYGNTVDTVTGVLGVDNQTEAANLATLVNRVNGDTPGEITGLVHTDLNIEITGGTNAGATAIPIEVAFYVEGIVLSANDFKGIYVFTQNATFESGAASEAYARVVDPSNAQEYDLQKNGVSFGTVNFPANTNAGTVTIGASTSFAKGDRLEIFGPASPGGLLNEIAITLTGSITV